MLLSLRRASSCRSSIPNPGARRTRAAARNAASRTVAARQTNRRAAARQNDGRDEDDPLWLLISIGFNLRYGDGRGFSGTLQDRAQFREFQRKPALAGSATRPRRVQPGIRRSQQVLGVRAVLRVKSGAQPRDRKRAARAGLTDLLHQRVDQLALVFQIARAEAAEHEHESCSHPGDKIVLPANPDRKSV